MLILSRDWGQGVRVTQDDAVLTINVQRQDPARNADPLILVFNDPNHAFDIVRSELVGNAYHKAGALPCRHADRYRRCKLRYALDGSVWWRSVLLAEVDMRGKPLVVGGLLSLHERGAWSWDWRIVAIHQRALPYSPDALQAGDMLQCAAGDQPGSRRPPVAEPEDWP